VTWRVSRKEASVDGAPRRPYASPLPAGPAATVVAAAPLHPPPLASYLRAARRGLGHLAEAAALGLVMAVFAALPVDRASAWGGRLARLIGPRLRVSHRALANLALAMPDNDAAENRRILRGMWDNLGRAIAEQPHLARICEPGSGRVEIVNGAAVAELLASGRSAMLFSGHFANWEVGPSTIHRLMGDQLLSVYRAANNPWVDHMQRWRLRERNVVAKGASGGRALLRHLHNGGHVAMLVDQKQNDGIAVPFFGIAAMTAPALARLGARFDCPIHPIRVERLNGARFRFTVLPAIDTAKTSDAAADVLATMTRVNATLEDWARARPEQWLWLHRRWPK
jgi:Kdo2-lipid IVA lauroyltransferase/acyltransferase